VSSEQEETGNDPIIEWRWRGDQAFALLSGLAGTEPVQIPAELATTEAARGGVATYHRTSVWQSRDYAWLRASEIWNNRGNHILSLGAFPRPERPAPILQAETVILRGRLFVVVLEIAPLLPDCPREGLSARDAQVWHDALHRRRPELGTPAPRPEWAEAVIAPWAIWTRPNDPSAASSGLEAMVEVARHVDGLAREGVWQDRPHPEVEEARLALRRILRTCRDAGPSKPMKRTLFGADWSERFFAEVFYPVERLT